jgi:hypothetical protein
MSIWKRETMENGGRGNARFDSGDETVCEN